MSLSDAGRERVLSAWAGRLGLADWPGGGRVVVARVDATAVVAVTLGEATVVLTPPSLAELVERSAAAELGDAELLTAALADRGAQAIGTAHLSYADDLPADSPGPSVGTTGLVDLADLAPLRQSVEPTEWDESGLGEMSRLWAVRTEGGEPVAAAGYDVWATHLAQLGVLAQPSNRGQGLASAAARAAVRDAQTAGLVAQWRSRVGNHPSYTLGGRLGFVELGLQTAVSVS